MSETPEAAAREKIDRLLNQCGWDVQSHAQMNITACPGVAVREFPLKTGFADYLLYADAKAIGIVEAKPEGHTLTGVEVQSAKYTSALPAGVPRYHLPLPFAYESTGAETQFTNNLDPSPRSREVFAFHRPEELIRLAKLDSQVRANLGKLPVLDAGRLWPVQSMAINTAERALRGIAVGRKNWLFAGSDAGGAHAAVFYTLIESCKAVGAEPFAYLRDIFARIAAYPARRIADLMPVNWAAARRAATVAPPAAVAPLLGGLVLPSGEAAVAQS
ncbi:MAG: transposase domain-containing protein [Planctomycetes bacterium]|nr:transposase domain-containing protein [Planctomycetota bacterium]